MTHSENNIIIHTLVYRINIDNYFEVSPLQKCLNESVVADIENVQSIVITKGLYKYANQIYDCRESGVYRFLNLPHCYTEKIVPAEDNFENVFNLGHLWNYAVAKYKWRNIRFFSKNHKKNGGCAELSEFAKNVLLQLGIKSRIIRGFTQEFTNGYDDGHTLLEIEIEPKKWIMYDPSFYNLFKVNGTYVNFYEFISKNNYDDLQIQKISERKLNYLYHIKKKDFGVWIEFRANNALAMLNWYKRVLYYGVFEDTFGHRFRLQPSNDKERIQNKKFMDELLIAEHELIDRFYT